MTPSSPAAQAAGSVRLWPGAIAVALQWLSWFVIPQIVPGAGIYGTFVGVGCGLAVVVWWLFFSRAPWADRIGALALMVVAVAATKRVVHPSISNGMMGLMVPVYSIPPLSLALVGALALTRRRPAGARRAAIAVAIGVACAAFTTLRTGGISGGGESDLHWRWTPTPEERLLAQTSANPDLVPPPAPATPAPIAPPPSTSDVKSDPSRLPAAVVPPSTTTAAAEWPGFRGPQRDGVVRGTRVATDWTRTPPVALWRRPVGPGWSSFAVRGDFIYTQEQRGDAEVVACYRLATGAPVWAHRDPVRFYESNGGAGPRATPTIDGGRVYAFGATGIVNALDAATGGVIWSRNAATDTGKKIPGWGFAGSPLVVGDLVVVAVSGQLAAYDTTDGSPRWKSPTHGGGYSSPHLTTIDGVPQVLLLSGGGAMGVSPSDGTLLWQHDWEEGVGIVQPACLDDGSVLVSGGNGMGGLGMQRVAVTHTPNGWMPEVRWTTRGLKPYFNDFVVHKGHAYGFDGAILSSIDLADGTRRWKGGRYGAGQLVLLPDQDLLLVLSEEGELALVNASPDQFTEVARVPALEGKTWNHPVVVGDVVLVRNGEVMAAFRIGK
jgi:outer membrane protein assembly factor BamB